MSSCMLTYCVSCVFLTLFLFLLDEYSFLHVSEDY